MVFWLRSVTENDGDGIGSTWFDMPIRRVTTLIIRSRNLPLSRLCNRCFQSDLPYDRFLHEQLAGDILARQAPESDYARLVVATGFIAQSKRIGTRELEDMHLIIEDTLTTLGPALMGLSLRCARCHDHKFEPISMEDYYALYGFFASTQYPFAGAEEVRKQTKFAPLIPPAEVKKIIDAHTAR